MGELRSPGSVIAAGPGPALICPRFQSLHENIYLPASALKLRGQLQGLWAYSFVSRDCGRFPQAIKCAFVSRTLER